MVILSVLLYVERVIRGQRLVCGGVSSAALLRQTVLTGGYPQCSGLGQYVVYCLCARRCELVVTGSYFILRQ